MAKLSQSEIEGYAADAGFTGNDIHIASAVAMAESGGNTNDHNTTPPDNSYGLWQINMLGTLGPSRRKQFGISSNDQLFDPRINAQAAHSVWKDSGWSAWTTYTTTDKKRTYQRFMAGSSSASDSSTSSGDGSNSSGITGAITNIGENLFKAASNLTGIIVAVVLLILGILLLARNQVGKVVPAGKIGKVVKAVSK